MSRVNNKFPSKVLSGRIVRGRGRSSEDLSELNSRLSLKLYPGSLNIIFYQPFCLRTSQANTLFDNNSRYLWKVHIKGCKDPVFAYRWKRAPLNILELVSPVMLRSELSLEDGDNISVSFEENVVCSPALVCKLAWALVWLGRIDWYYKRDRYKKFVYKYLKVLSVLGSQDSRFARDD